jgi:hypothetical protein
LRQGSELVGRDAQLAAGTYLKYMFQYKQKSYYKDHKTETDDWFPTQVRPFNAPVFVELRQVTGFYVRFKYYLSDFLAIKTCPLARPARLTWSASVRKKAASITYRPAGCSKCGKNDTPRSPRFEVSRWANMLMSV